MSCPTANGETAELLLAHASRRLDAERAAVLEGHLARCPACRDYYAAQLAVWAALDDWEAPPVSSDFNRRLYRRIEAEGSRWEFLRPLRALLEWRAAPLACAVCLMVAGGVWLGRPGSLPYAVPQQTAGVQVLPPDQAASALQQMEMMQEFSRLVHADSGDPRM